MDGMASLNNAETVPITVWLSSLPDTESDSDGSLVPTIVECQIFILPGHKVKFQPQLPSIGMGFKSGFESESVSGKVDEPLHGVRNKFLLKLMKYTTRVLSRN